jgi:mono/diheme cytochrome c family protein
MSAIQKNLFSTAVGTALALFAFGCGEQSDAPTPPKPAEAAPAPPPDEAPAPPAPPAPAEVPDTPPAESAAVEADVKAGKADYEIYCASCHGKTGAGDGPLGQVLNPKPARHDDGAYMNPLTDDHLFKVIKFGGAAVGKSPTMAPLGLSDQQIYNVIAFIRTLAEPPYQP